MNESNNSTTSLVAGLEDMYGKRKELQDRLDEMNRVIQASVDAQKQRRCDLVAQSVDLLLELSPDHDRRACSDLNPCNIEVDDGAVRCTRCQLLNIQKFRHSEFVAKIWLIPRSSIREQEEK